MPLDADIEALDLDGPACKVCIDERWTVEEVDAEVRRYRAFLHAIRHYPGSPLAPSHRVDKVWHAHILDTQKYIADCQYIFGAYVHHYPYSGLRGEDDAEVQRRRFESTQQLIATILSS